MQRKYLIGLLLLLVFIIGSAFAYSSIVFVKFIGTDGARYDLKFIDGKPRFSSMDYLYDIAEGNVSGHTPWSKIGQSTTLSTNTEDVWPGGGTYYPPLSGCSMQVYSTNAGDASAGIGVRTATIYYLDTDYKEKQETVTLNGLTAVTTSATNIYRINHFRAATVGSHYNAMGNISVYPGCATGGGGTSVFARMSTGFTRGRNVFYTVPDGQNLHITSILFSSSLTANKSSVLFTTRATYDNRKSTVLSPLFYMPFHETYITDSTFERPLEIPTKLPSRTDLKVSVKSSAASTLCTTALRGWLETN